MIKKCLGCGTLMQNEDINRPGYTTDISRDYCKRCFRLMHYNEIPKVFATNKEFLQVIDYQLKKKNLFIYLIDIFSFPISFNKDITDRLRGKDVIIVINKIDLLPKSLNPQNLINFVSKQCEKIFFKVVAIHLISAKKGYYLTDLMQHLELFRKERDICILGLASVGKSSFINAILKQFGEAKSDTIATSPIPGTTLEEITIPFFLDNRGFIDTPGLISQESVLTQVSPKDYNLLLPTAEISPVTYQLFGSYTYFLGGLVYLAFNDIKNASLVIYKAKNLPIIKVKTDNLAKTLTKVGLTILPAAKEINIVERQIIVDGVKTIFIGGFLIIQITGKLEFLLGYNQGLGVKEYGNVFRRTN